MKKRIAKVDTETLVIIDKLSERIRKNEASVREYKEYERLIMSTGAYTIEDMLKPLTDCYIESYSELIDRRKNGTLEDKRVIEGNCIVTLVAIGLSLIFSAKNPVKINSLKTELIEFTRWRNTHPEYDQVCETPLVEMYIDKYRNQ